MNQDEVGYIYVIRQVGTNYYKIGFSETHPERRWKELKTGTPNGLKVITYFRGSMRDEARLHEAFKRFARHGEWFKCDAMTLLTVAIDATLGHNTVPKVNIDKFEGVQTFLKEHYAFHRKTPKDQFDGTSQEELYDRYCEWIFRKDSEGLGQDEFFKALMALPFPRKSFNGQTILSLHMKPDSDLVLPDY